MFFFAQGTQLCAFALREAAKSDDLRDGCDPVKESGSYKMYILITFGSHDFLENTQILSGLCAKMSCVSNFKRVSHH